MLCLRLHILTSLTFSLILSFALALFPLDGAWEMVRESLTIRHSSLVCRSPDDLRKGSFSRWSLTSIFISPPLETNNTTWMRVKTRCDDIDDRQQVVTVMSSERQHHYYRQFEWVNETQLPNSLPLVAAMMNMSCDNKKWNCSRVASSRPLDGFVFFS